MDSNRPHFPYGPFDSHEEAQKALFTVASKHRNPSFDRYPPSGE